MRGNARVIAETAHMRKDLAEFTMPEELAAGLTQFGIHRTRWRTGWQGSTACAGRWGRSFRRSRQRSTTPIAAR